MSSTIDLNDYDIIDIIIISVEENLENQENLNHLLVCMQARQTIESRVQVDFREIDKKKC